MNGYTNIYICCKLIFFSIFTFISWTWGNSPSKSAWFKVGRCSFLHKKVDWSSTTWCENQEGLNILRSNKWRVENWKITNTILVVAKKNFDSKPLHHYTGGYCCLDLCLLLKHAAVYHEQNKHCRIEPPWFIIIILLNMYCNKLSAHSSLFISKHKPT